MRIAILSAALATTTFAAVPASAQQRPSETNREYRDDVRDARQDYPAKAAPGGC